MARTAEPGPWGPGPRPPGPGAKGAPDPGPRPRDRGPGHGLGLEAVRPPGLRTKGFLFGLCVAPQLRGPSGLGCTTPPGPRTKVFILGLCAAPKLRGPAGLGCTAPGTSYTCTSFRVVHGPYAPGLGPGPTPAGPGGPGARGPRPGGVHLISALGGIHLGTWSEAGLAGFQLRKFKFPTGADVKQGCKRRGRSGRQVVLL